MDKYKLLLVDDDEDEYIIITDLLYDIHDKTFEFVWVTDSDQALAALQNNHFDVALVDYRLGRDSGIDLIHLAAEAGISTPLIILTGQEQREVDEQALAAGAADYLVKGQFDANQLERSIRYTVSRHQAQEQLKENEMRMGFAFEAARIGTWDWDIPSDKITWSARAESLFNNLPLNKIAGNSRAYEQFVYSEDLPLFLAAARKAVKYKKNFHIEYRVQLPNDHLRWVDVRGESIRNAQDRAVRLIGTMMDITERKEVEEALRLNEQRLRTLISHIPVILFTLDNEGTFTLSEGKGLASLGLKPGQVVGQSMREFYKGVPRIIQNIDQALAGEMVESTGPVNDLMYHSFYIPLFNENGEVDGLIGLAVDITEFHVNEEILKEKLSSYQTNTAALLQEISTTISQFSLPHSQTSRRQTLFNKLETFINSPISPNE